MRHYRSVSSVLKERMQYAALQSGCPRIVVCKAEARGRPQTTLPITLNNDLKNLVATKLELTTQTDLDTLCLIAEDRPKWNALVTEIRKTAEAARSDDPARGQL
ncbi:hypothetical protein PoB_006032700 [Plakobranchus ocellatus]|uniref:Uncharacterized protein n=1 Tax=Plakobranchus ocellatus TaxID=259542 RepID=A0AAV4CPM1_9GAST|nr:hypothetical protein PoB_006032700 [Plakobranchus ocellatus]